jgi:hypothetical protein
LLAIRDPTRYGKLRYHIHEERSSWGVADLFGGKQPIELSRETRMKIMELIETDEAINSTAEEG